MNDAIIVGIKTVLKDNPSLTARIPKGRDPVRVIIDSSLRIPENAKVITQSSAAQTTSTLAHAPKAKIKTPGCRRRSAHCQGQAGTRGSPDLMRKLAQEASCPF
jgi:diaminohydroxyphosphoribosylaminopyrimidine deaminase/5-amino-6-(5-phosphoribosylamino)uracil reductase